MSLYRVHFFDHGDNILSVRDIEGDDDDAAIAAAHGLNVLPHITAGFEVWEGDRFVHRHSN